MLREPEDRDIRPPSRVRDWIFAIAAVTIGACLVVNVIRGIIGQGWNW